MSISIQLALSGLVMFVVGFMFAAFSRTDKMYRDNSEVVFSYLAIISFCSIPVLWIIAIWI